MSSTGTGDHSAAKAATDQAWAALASAFEAKSGLLREEDAKIAARSDALEAKKAELARQNGGEDVSPEDEIRINVGGEIVICTRATLTLFQGTRFEALFSGRWEDKLLRDANGYVFLDVHPGCFKKIVEYLRRKKMAGPDDEIDLPYIDKDEEQEIFSRQLAFFELDDVIVPRNFGFDSEFDSIILTDPQHFQALGQWMAEDGVTGSLQLLYRASAHGWTSQNFHQHCDNKGATLTVIKTRNAIFGGFVSDSWLTHGQYCGGTNPGKTFLYALQCNAGLPPTKMPHKPGNQYGGYHNQSYGPAFGSNHDVYVGDYSRCDCCSCSPNGGPCPTGCCNCGVGQINIGGSYELPAGQNGQNFLTGDAYLRPTEIEVYHVSSIIQEGIPGQSADELPWQTAEFTEFTPAVNSALTTEQAALVEAQEYLVVQEKLFDRETAFVEFFSTGETKEIVTFVCSTEADRPISVKLSTLTQVEESMLGAKFRETWTQKDAAADDPKLWDVERVIEAVLQVKGVPESIADSLREEEINGEDLLALDHDGLKELGCKKLGARSRLMERIRELRQAATGGGATKSQLVEYSHYSFSKIIDQLRLRAMCQGDDALPPSPFVKKSERSDFKNIVEYYFPGELAASISDFKYTPEFKVRSSIIQSPEHVQALGQWMAEDGVTGSLQLLYRASAHGWTSQNFHQHCDNKGATLTVIKTRNAIFGGFVSDSWLTHGQYCGGTNPGKTFLYALQCNAGLPPTKMPHKPGNQYGGYHNQSYGPAFGSNQDVYVGSYSRCGCCSCSPNGGPCPTGCCNCGVGQINIGGSYELPAGQNGQNFLTGDAYLRPTEIEVFQLTAS
eukprot:COSAG02_NODE_2948_length_7680_cov_7.843029_3_plen_840_part_00